MAKVSKVVFGNETIMDISQDTVDAAHLLTGYTAHGSDGEEITGTCAFDCDTSGGDALAGEILEDKVAYVAGNEVVGTMPNRGAVSGTIDDKDTPYTIPQGYHDGTGTVDIDSTEKAKIIAGNIKAGVTILGVVGNYSGESSSVEPDKTVTPYTTAQTVLPDTGYDYLAQVSVEAIAYTETTNAGGGKTATIGTVAP